ncbi:MAG: hypothetical protein HYZ93_05980 [Candidatus Omnitrophica bacterium]|nr:hypothetical protein [Candidatus Omnitrophota bacterium]
MTGILTKILRVFERHRLWEDGVELIGSWCFYLYQRHLGVKPYPFRTQDVDFLLPYPFRGTEKINLIQELEELGFRHDFRSDGSVYLRSAELQIDFIIPEHGRGRGSAPAISSLGLRPMPLRFVDILLEHPISVTESGMRISVPDPAAFCLHKLLIAPRRPLLEKRAKDFEQALHIVPILKKERLRGIYLDLPKAWRKRILQSLQQAAQYAPLLEEQSVSLAGTLQSFE